MKYWLVATSSRVIGQNWGWRFNNEVFKGESITERIVMQAEFENEEECAFLSWTEITKEEYEKLVEIL